MERTAKVLGDRVRMLRERKGLTQERLSEACGLSLKHLGQIERGKGNPTLSSLDRLAQALDIPLGDLLAIEHLLPENDKLPDVVHQIVKDSDELTRRLIFRVVKALKI